MHDVFVFAGQSNMMGAAALPPQHKLKIGDSVEYKYKSKYLGAKIGRFTPVTHECGEYLYIDNNAAYTLCDNSGRSMQCDYWNNTHFVSSMSNVKDYTAKTIQPFENYCESMHRPSPCIPTYFCEYWEALGHRAIIAHVAKGGVNIAHYFDSAMQAEYNQLIHEKFGDRYCDMTPGANSAANGVFCDKVSSLFADAEAEYGKKNIGKRVLVWLQGESNANDADDEYELKLDILWKRAKALGFDKMAIIRVDYWYEHSCVNIMRAEERFCEKHSDCFMATRALSLMPELHSYPNYEGWYMEEPQEPYLDCRDSFFGFDNNHINEKGMMLAARRAAKNCHKVLYDGEQPILEPDTVCGI